MKLVIIGGVAGGASAATRFRRLSEDSQIVMIERGPDVSFANCGLPYYIGEKIADRKKLLVTSVEQLHSRFNLDVRVNSTVEAIDPREKIVRIREAISGKEYTENYDKLIIATGAAPVLPKIPGINLPGVYTLRNLQDTDKIKAYVDRGINHAIIVGAGFIGLELAENFVRRGITTTVIERNDQILAPFDKEMTTPVVQELEKEGVKILLGKTVDSIQKTDNGLSVDLNSGESFNTDLIIYGIGVRPENKLAVEAGLAVGPRGGIRVNKFLETSDSSIFAVGDVIEVTDFITGEQTQVPLAGPANRQGRIAADNAFGRSIEYRGTQGTAIIGVFDCTAAMTGASEKVLKRSGRKYRKVYIHPSHHAGYYPGAESMTLKILFDPETGLLLGAQGVGGSGVDKRIDIIATAIQAHMTVFDLEEMELSYSPQYGSAKDPVNMLGFVAGGLLRGDHPQIDVDMLLVNQEEDSSYVLDVRTTKEFSGGHIPSATNIPIDELRSRLDELPRDKEIISYCQVGQRGYLATRILLQEGFTVRNIGGGYKTYKLFHNNNV